MEFKTLILGLFMSTAAFSLKAGGGLAYLFVQKPGLGKKAALGAVFAAVYGLVFGLCAIILLTFNLPRHMDMLQTFFKSGMTIHFILALLISVWGIRLLLRNHNDFHVSKAWLPLVVPCPVCFSVILLSCSFLAAMFPGNRIVFAELYAGFIAVSLIFATLFAAFIRHPENAHRFLGMLMLYIAAYFMLSVIIIPQFADLEKVYRISSSVNEPSTLTNEHLVVLTICLAALLSGFAASLIHALKEN